MLVLLLLGTSLLPALAGDTVAQRARPARFRAQLVNPETIQLGTGGTTTQLSTSKDYIIKLPAGEKRGYTAIVGGRNVLIDGGTIVMSGTGTDMQRRGLYIKNATGTVRIQNVTIRGTSPTTAFDAVAIAAPQATVELVNINVSNLGGSYSGYHGDIVQPFGGVRRLVINGLTGRTGYQGLYLAYSSIGAVDLRNVNLSFLPNPYQASSVMIWFHGCSSYPVTMQNVTIQPRDGQSVSRVVRPNGGSCPIRRSGSQWSWPASSSIDGVITQGVPSSGSGGGGEDGPNEDDGPGRGGNAGAAVRIAAQGSTRPGHKVRLSVRGMDSTRLVGVTFGVCDGRRCGWGSARKLGTDKRAPFAVNWGVPRRAGTYTIIARAVDVDGDVIMSKPKRITVKNPQRPQRNRRR